MLFPAAAAAVVAAAVAATAMMLAGITPFLDGAVLQGQERCGGAGEPGHSGVDQGGCDQTTVLATYRRQTLLIASTVTRPYLYHGNRSREQE